MQRKKLTAARLAERVQSESAKLPARDAITRLRHRMNRRPKPSGRLGTPEKQKQKIEAMLTRARARKQQKQAPEKTVLDQ